MSATDVTAAQGSFQEGSRRPPGDGRGDSAPWENGGELVRASRVPGALLPAGAVTLTICLLLLAAAGLGQWLYPAPPAVFIVQGGSR